MANEITYEVYTLANGRWILDSRFRNDQRERAIDEGKQLAKLPGIEAVKVVRETYDENDNLIKESTVFSTKQAAAESAGRRGESRGSDYDFGRKPATRGGAGADDDDDDSAGAGRSDATPRSGPTGRGAPAVLRRPEFVLVYKMVIIGVVSFAFAAIVTYVFAANFS